LAQPLSEKESADSSKQVSQTETEEPQGLVPHAPLMTGNDGTKLVNGQTFSPGSSLVLEPADSQSTAEFGEETGQQPDVDGEESTHLHRAVLFSSNDPRTSLQRSRREARRSLQGEVERSQAASSVGHLSSRVEEKKSNIRYYKSD
jgi:hypothetical protein